jgi:Flp pilus assembly protein CpaB
MSSRRTLILIAAIVIGAVAAYALFNYINGIEDRAYGDAELVDVWKVDRDIPKGLPGEQATSEEYVVASQIPREFLPANSIRNTEQLTGLVALNDLSANQVLVDGMFVDPASALISFAERLDADEVTATIAVDQISGVAGLLVPGDKVNMLVRPGLYDYPEDNPDLPLRGPGTPDSEGLEFVLIGYGDHARYLYQAVEILAIGRSPVPQPGETVDSAALAGQAGQITFRVPPEAVPRIISAINIYLSLTSPEYEPRVLPMFDPYEVLPAEDPARLTPYGPDGRE